MNDSDYSVDAWLEKGKLMLQDKFVELEAYPRLSDLLQSSSSSEYSKPIVNDWQIISLAKSIPLPDILFDQYDLLNSRCFMGLFPEINRAWITVDHRLFIWNYEEGNDFYTFEEQDQIIVNVVLAKPKKGVFSEEISHVLVIATVMEIFLLGVSLTKKSSSYVDLVLYSTQFKVSADNIVTTAMCSTEEGRIFLSGSDGHIYEILYQESDGWLTKKCTKVCLTSNVISYFVPTFFSFSSDDPVLSFAVDNERSILYLLTQKSSIEVIYLGINKNDFERVIRHKNIYSDALIMSPSFGAEGRNDFEIVSIQVVSKFESQSVHLVAITSSGVRLHFSTFKRENRIYNRDINKPQTLELVHVRKLDLVSKGNLTVHNGIYDNGLTIMANASTEDYDQLVTTNLDNLSIQQFISRHGKSGLIEWSSSTNIEGKTWAIAKIGEKEPVDLNDLNVVNFTSRTKYLVLTNSGVNILLKQYPIDMMLWLISQRSVIDGDAIALSEGFGTTEMCAMCLSVLTSDDSSQRKMPVNTIKNCTALFFEYGGSPTIKANVMMAAHLVGKVGVPQVIFSGRHDGMLLFLSRLLINVWKKKVFKLVKQNDQFIFMDLGISESVLSEVQSRLIRLQTFINRNQSFIPDLSSGNIPKINENIPVDSFNLDFNKTSANCWQLEADSLLGLYSLIQQIIESISFLFIVMDFNKNVVATDVDNSIKAELSETPFSSLATSTQTRKLCRDLVSAMISSRISQNETVESVSKILGTRCGSFFSSKDIKLYRALEYLKVAQNLKDSNTEPEQQQALLQECLDMFVDSGILLGKKKFSQCVNVFIDFSWSVGALTLCLNCAKNEDPNDLALEYYNYDKLKNVNSRDIDPAIINMGKEKYEWRIYCYKLALNIIKPPELELNNKLLTQSLVSSDILFHLTLYDYLMSQRLDSVLIQIDTPYLVDYFRMGEPSLEKINLLWKHLVYMSKYAQAAIILYDLALGKLIESIPLSSRLEYLSLAISNAKSSLHYEPDYLPATLLNTMTDQFKTAQIQMEILQILKPKHDQQPTVNKLNSGFYNVTELYDQFAQPFHLYEQILLIYKLSNYQDRVQVFEIWNYLVFQSTESAYEDGKSMDSVRSLVAISSKVSKLGSRLYPSDAAFPLDLVFGIMVVVVLDSSSDGDTGGVSEIKGAANSGFISQLLVDCGVSYPVIYYVIVSFLQDMFGEMENNLAGYSITSSNSNSTLKKSKAISSKVLATPTSIISAAVSSRINSAQSEGRKVPEQLLNSEKAVASILLRELINTVEKWLIVSHSAGNSDQEIHTEDYEDGGFPAVSVDNLISQYVMSSSKLVDRDIVNQLQQLQSDIRQMF